MFNKIITTIAGGTIGLIAGTILGLAVGGVLDLFLKPIYGYWFLWGGFLGVLTGLISGIGVNVVGMRSRYGLEWPLILISAVPLGFFLMSHVWNWNSWKFILTVSLVNAVAGWLTVLLIQRFYGGRLPRRPFHLWTGMGYLAVFAILAYVGPRLLQIIAIAISP